MELESLGVKKVGQSTVVVAGGFETNMYRESEAVLELRERSEIRGRVLDPDSLSVAPTGTFD